MAEDINKTNESANQDTTIDTSLQEESIDAKEVNIDAKNDTEGVNIDTTDDTEGVNIDTKDDTKGVNIDTKDDTEGMNIDTKDDTEGDTQVSPQVEDANDTKDTTNESPTDTEEIHVEDTKQEDGTSEDVGSDEACLNGAHMTDTSENIAEEVTASQEVSTSPPEGSDDMGTKSDQEEDEDKEPSEAGNKVAHTTCTRCPLY